MFAEPSFLSEIVAEGRVLVDRGDLWQRLQRRPNRSRRQNESRRAGAALAGIDRLLAG